MEVARLKRGQSWRYGLTVEVKRNQRGEIIGTTETQAGVLRTLGLDARAIWMMRGDPSNQSESGAERPADQVGRVLATGALGLASNK